jgi:hypothetical protein
MSDTDGDLFLEGKKCVSCVIVHIDGVAVFLHDEKHQQISTSIATVKKSHLYAVLENAPGDALLGKVRDSMDIARYPIEAAFAYAAAQNASLQFGLRDVLTAGPTRLVGNNCPITTQILSNNDCSFRMMTFSISIEPTPAVLDELEQKFIMVDRKRVISKPTNQPGELMEVFYQGLKMTKMSGIVTLLFWDLRYA